MITPKLFLKDMTHMDTTKPVLDFYSKNKTFMKSMDHKIEEIAAKIDAFLNV